MFSQEEEPLIRTGDVAGRWKEHPEELLSTTNVFSAEEAESEDSREDSSISLTDVVKMLHSGKVPGVDEICPEMLKAQDIVGLS